MRYTIGFTGLPFKFYYRQILYVENTYDRYFNKIISDNYKTIVDIFQEYGFEFCYMPKMLKIFQELSYIAYHEPYAKDVNMAKEMNLESFNILDYMTRPQNRGRILPSFIYYCSDFESNETVFWA